MDYYQPLLAGETFHIVSRATGSELLFKEPENYRFFLQRFHKYISPIADTYAYALLPNHFHFLVHIKPYDELEQLYIQQKKNTQTSNDWQPAFVMQQFSNQLNSYTKSFNKKYQRKGALFMDYLRRVQIMTDEQFYATTFYIHKNPVHHGLCSNMEDWRWSSYKAILTDASTNIKRQKLIDWFGSVEAFIKYHDKPIHPKSAIIVE